MKRPTTKTRPVKTGDPYIDGRNAWNERYGDLISQVRSWKMIALATTGGMVVLGGALAWNASQASVVPYVVQVDQMKTVLPVGRADQARTPDATIVRASLRNWIEEVRTVTPDAYAQRQHVQKAFTMLAQGTEGYQVVYESLIGPNSPFKRAAKETVSVEVQSVLPVGGDSWRIEWQEITRGRNGEVAKSVPWSAVVSVRLQPPKDEAQILVNPLGIYITGLSWAARV
ncbi:VirB8/TrbF family protein (plasmid) [Brevundimonas olei]|uniref:VirB8/TrbF family protein n=1 Tax=Brevundimonas olei TaxID=657642 RepID=A0ABZ2IG43_9CAUL